MIRADSVASVYRVRGYFTETLEGERFRESFIAIRGCVRGARRSVQLGAPVEGVGSAGGSQGGGVSGIKLRGTMVAFEESFSSEQAGGAEPRDVWRVVVRDLRSSRILHRLPTGTEATPRPRRVGVGPTTAIAVDRRGDVAWIARIVEAPVFAAYEIHLISGHTESVLASGGDIDPKLLSIAAGRVRWRQGGVAKSARLDASLNVASARLAAARSAGALPKTRKRACDAVPRARLVVASAEAQIYRSVNKLSQPYFYGCAYAGHQVSYALGAHPECSPSGCAGTDALTLCGSIAAYEQFSTDSRLWRVLVRDLRTGRLLRQLQTGGGFVKDVVVARNGAVAWTVEVGLHEYALHAVDAGGSRILASGGELAPRSLALAGSTLYWTQAGRAVSSPLA